MERLTTTAAFAAYCRRAPRPLGLVPTMGALHAGHARLLNRARAECATVVATIFVNPAQFSDPDDFAAYPRDRQADLMALEAAGIDAVFVPSSEEVYPDGHATVVRVAGPATPLEGEARPGHFDGVATVVAKLLIAAEADQAYFGQKDAQQLAVVRRLRADLGVHTEIIAVPTVREPDGLALSSRNVLLSPEHRAVAPVLHRALQAGAACFSAGVRDRETIEAASRAVLDGASDGLTVDYLALVEPDTMAPWQGGAGLLVGAVRLGSVRLIDNLLLVDPRSKELREGAVSDSDRSVLD